MKKTIIAFCFAFAGINAHSQDASVAQNLFGFHLGIVSAGFEYETKLARKVALHLETGVALIPYTVEFSGSDTEQAEYILTPYFVAEPRWYYGLDRRAKKGKHTAQNSSNYVSLKTIYNANDWEISNSEPAASVVPSLSFIPSYGIRRSFAKHFNYEFAFGVGYQYNVFSANEGCNCDHNEINMDLQAKIGYNF